MAVVREFTLRDLARASSHSEVEATIARTEQDGERFIQIDTHGSKDQAIRGKPSRSLRLSQAVFEQLSTYAAKHF
jgi:hypothetical protein